MVSCTLLTDGSSDWLLKPIIEWTFENVLRLARPKIEWADLTRHRPGLKLIDRIPIALNLYPCDILFIHRDAENIELLKRRSEINLIVDRLGLGFKYVPIVPVRMSESWILIEERAIRIAAGNPNGKSRINLPKPHKLENVQDPKQALFGKLIIASNLKGRHLKKFNPYACRRLIAENIQDFSTLNALPSFKTFCADLKVAMTS